MMELIHLRWIRVSLINEALMREWLMLTSLTQIAQRLGRGRYRPGRTGTLQTQLVSVTSTRARLLEKPSVSASREHRLFMGVLGSLAVTMDLH